MDDEKITVDDFVDIFNKLASESNENKYSLIYLIIGSKISADTLLTKEDCLESKEYLKMVDEAIDKSSEMSENDKNVFKKYIKDGIEICDKDYNRYESITE